MTNGSNDRGHEVEQRAGHEVIGAICPRFHSEGVDEHEVEQSAGHEGEDAWSFWRAGIVPERETAGYEPLAGGGWCIHSAESGLVSAYGGS